jgi:hypothetical protein
MTNAQSKIAQMPVPNCSVCDLTEDECDCEECLGCKKKGEGLDDYHCEECHNCEDCGAEQCKEWLYDEQDNIDVWVCIHCQEDKEAEEDTDCEWCEETHKCEDKCVKPEPVQTYTHIWAF